MSASEEGLLKDYTFEEEIGEGRTPTTLMSLRSRGAEVAEAIEVIEVTKVIEVIKVTGVIEVIEGIEVVEVPAVAEFIEATEVIDVVEVIELIGVPEADLDRLELVELLRRCDHLLRHLVPQTVGVTKEPIAQHLFRFGVYVL